MTKNRLLNGPKPAKLKRRAIFRWQVFCGRQWVGDVVMLEAPPTADLSVFDFLYDGVTPSGEMVGPFEKRGDAAVAIAQAAQP